MLRRIVIIYILTLGLTATAFAADNPTTEERLVGGTFKTLAKAYVATLNVEDLKAKNIKRIESMKPEWFSRKYAEVYGVAKELPPKIKAKYRITERMTKNEAISIVETLDKPKLYELIDNVPDPVIAEKFFDHLPGDGSKSGGNLMDSIGQAWDKLVKKINRSTPHKTQTQAH